jgi:hypothetical protein
MPILAKMGSGTAFLRLLCSLQWTMKLIIKYNYLPEDFDVFKESCAA